MSELHVWIMFSLGISISPSHPAECNCKHSGGDRALRLRKFLQNDLWCFFVPRNVFDPTIFFDIMNSSWYRSPLGDLKILVSELHECYCGILAALPLEISSSHRCLENFTKPNIIALLHDLRTSK